METITQDLLLRDRHGFRSLPIVSVVVPFWGYPFRILNIRLV